MILESVLRESDALRAELLGAADSSPGVAAVTASQMDELARDGCMTLDQGTRSTRRAMLGLWLRALTTRGEPIVLLPVGRGFGTALERDALLCLFAQLLRIQPDFESGRALIHDVTDLRDEVQIRLSAPAPGPDGKPIALLLERAGEASSWDVEALLATPRSYGLRIVETREHPYTSALLDGPTFEGDAPVSAETHARVSTPPARIELAVALALGPVPEAILAQVLWLGDEALAAHLHALAARIERADSGLRFRDEDERAEVERGASDAEKEALLEALARAGLRTLSTAAPRSPEEEGYWADFLAAHLALARSPLADQLALISPAWERRSRGARPDPLWFAWDVERIRAGAERLLLGAPACPAAAAMVRAALVESSLRALRGAPGAKLADGASRARVLLALAALADEPERARLLTLAEQSAREPPIEARALLELAATRAGEARAALVAEALANLPAEATARSRAQLAAAALVPEAEVTPLLREAFAALTVDDLGELARRAARFPEPARRIAGEVALASHTPARRALLGVLVPVVPAEMQAALACAVAHEARAAIRGEIEDPALTDPYEDLARIVPWLPASALAASLDDRDEMDPSGARRVLPLIAARLAALGHQSPTIAQYAPRPRKRPPPPSEDEQLAAARAATPSARAFALAQVAARLEASPSARAASVAAEAVGAARETPPEDAIAYLALADLGALLEPADAAFVFGRALDSLVRRPRPEMLAGEDSMDLRRLVPLILRIGGAELLVATGEAIMAIAAWYP